MAITAAIYCLGGTSPIQDNGRFSPIRWVTRYFPTLSINVRFKRRVARAEKVVSEQWKVFGMQMRNDANLEKDNTGKETSSANSTSTITKQTSLCAAALQGVAHPSDGSPELLDDHDCKIALSDHHQFTIAFNLVPFGPSPPPPRPPFVWWLVQWRITQPLTYLAWSFRFLRSSSRCR